MTGIKSEHIHDTDWSNLPDLALSQIVQHLDLTSIVNFWSVCTRWRHTASSAQSWWTVQYNAIALQEALMRKQPVMDLRVVGLNMLAYRKTVQIPQSDHEHNFYNNLITCIQMYGHNIRHLMMSHIEDPVLARTIPQTQTRNILHTLANNCCNLKTLRVTLHKGNSAVTLINKFLMKNSQLREVSLCDIGPLKQMAMHLTERNSFEKLLLKNLHFPETSCSYITHLCLLNCEAPANLSNLAHLENVEKLFINQHCLEPQFIKHLSARRLQEICITPSIPYSYVSFENSDWGDVIKLAPNLKVHLLIKNPLNVGGVKSDNILDNLLQPLIPLTSLIFGGGFNLDYDSIADKAAAFYHRSLCTFVDTSINVCSPASTINISNQIERLCDHCTNLSTVATCGIISTSALEAIARRSVCLKYLYICKAQLIYDGNVFTEAALSDVMSSILGAPWWPMSDKEFEQVTLDNVVRLHEFLVF